MDDHHRSTAPAVRSRPLTRGRALLGLIVVLTLLALLPAGASADLAGDLRLDASGALYDATSEGEAPAAEPPAESDPPPSDPAPAPSDPDPAPADPAPAPTDPAPAPSDPAPAPSDPAPAPSDPAPAPTDPAASEPAPTTEDPSPSPPVEETAPPTLRDVRAPAPKPGDAKPDPSGEEAVPLTGETLLLPAATPTDPADEDAAASPAQAEAADEGVATQTKVVQAALRRLGIGTIAAPAAVDVAQSAPVALPSACTPIGAYADVAAPQTGDRLGTHPVVRAHRVDGDPPLVRGPPAPLDSPSGPFATASSGTATSGGVNGERDSAILADQIAFTLAERGTPAAGASSEHIASAPANAAARAPPVA